MGLDYILYNGNEAFYALIGQNSFKPFTYGIHPEDVEEFIAVSEALKEGESAVLAIRYQGYYEGKYQLYEVTITHNVAATGEIVGYCVKLINFIMLKNVYRRNTSNVRKYRTFMSMISVYYYEYDMKKNFFKVYIYIYERSYVLVCEDFDDWYERMLKESVRSEKDRASLDKFAKSLKNGKADFTIHLWGSFFSKDNAAEELICTGKTVNMFDGDYVFGVIRNVEGYIDRNRAYYFTEAGKDPATGLLNKRAAKEFSKDLLSDGSGSRRYMLVIDVDDFKNFNDSYGHIFGDDVILKVSRVLANTVNLRGIVGRIGGDEFYVLTENIDSEKDLRVLLKTISKNLFYAYENEKEGVHISTSIGVSCYPDDGTTYDELFKKADKALYIAKEKGKSRFIIYDEEKHGAISDGEAEAEKFKPALKAELCADVVSKLAIKLASEGASAVCDIIETVCDVFDIGGVRIVSAEGEVLHYFGDGARIASAAEGDYSFLDLEEYKKLYSDASVYAVNNVQNIEKFSKATSDAMLEMNIVSFLHVAYPTINEPAAFMFFDIFKGLRKWSEEDKNFLMILGRLLLDAILKDKKR
ncbi:MAG: GGDEF domain-containing protein [Lachnospiraceae bacterium]|nr:GGDEF domain-containing protein [Lachnospiraceae bacterium]